MLREWAAPTFSTTTIHDKTVAAVLLMATLKDWENILQRLEKLKEYGIETIAWYHLPRPIISRFLAAFDGTNEAENFWQCIAHYTPGGSGGGEFYSGWVSAFSVFNKKGNHHSFNPNNNFVLDGTPYHRMYTADVAPGYGEVDVPLIQAETRDTFPSVMIAGMVGTRVGDSNDKGEKMSEGGKLI
ncbi:hypothetical protein R3P38DRAFT_3324103 [Favolaschia claudopus]|uniref:Uncharacterized protein n=1 Tax=Favolaschia claudopus TaxID=2862362 RepID=A0AAW0AHI3_9AGAR